LAQIDHDLVLMSEIYDQVHRQFLLRIDFSAQKCPILDTAEFELSNSRIITDSMNCSKVAYLEYSDGDFVVSYDSMRKGRVINNQISMDDHKIDFGEDFYFCKLQDDKIYGFRGIGCQFCEFSFDMDSGHTVKGYSSEFPDYFDHHVSFK